MLVLLASIRKESVGKFGTWMKWVVASWGDLESSEQLNSISEHRFVWVG